MLSFDQIKNKVLAALPGARVQLKDLTGGGDHLWMQVVSDQFAGKTRVARHRLVYAALAQELQGAIHALQLETLTPQEEE